MAILVFNKTYTLNSREFRLLELVPVKQRFLLRLCKHHVLGHKLRTVVHRIGSVIKTQGQEETHTPRELQANDIVA